MPRIDAPTVVEHRRLRRERLLGAARTLLVEEGAGSVTPARVGQAAGIARNSVYTYFDSRGQILAELVESDFSEWNDRVADAIARADGPDERLETYLRVNLELAADGGHRVAAAMGAADLPDACRSRIAELHRESASLLHEILTEFVPDASAATILVRGVLDGALMAIEQGAQVAELVDAVMVFVRDGLAGLEATYTGDAIRRVR